MIILSRRHLKHLAKEGPVAFLKQCLACINTAKCSLSCTCITVYASTNIRQQKHCVFRSSVRPSVVHCLSVNTCFACRYICALSGGILVKIAMNIRHLSGHCWKGFQIRRSKVKVSIYNCNIIIFIYTHWQVASAVYKCVNAVMEEAHISATSRLTR